MPVFYTIRYLLSKQPKIFKKNPQFKAIIIYFKSDPSLEKIRLPKTCYRILNNASLKAENLTSFYRKYNLAASSFYPFFLKIKAEYLKKIEEKKEIKKKYISENFKKLDPIVKEYICYLSNFEKIISGKKSSPLWSKIINPDTKKKVDGYLKYGKIEWTELFKKFLSDTGRIYKKYDKKYTERLINLFILELPIRKNSDAEIINKYRILSKIYHPDAGGNEQIFKLINNAKSELLKN